MWRRWSQAARRNSCKGSRHVVVKGGHLDGPPSMSSSMAEGSNTLKGSGSRPRALHGTGCTFASAIAAELAKGAAVTEAVRRAKAYNYHRDSPGEPIGMALGPRIIWRPVTVKRLATTSSCSWRKAVRATGRWDRHADSRGTVESGAGPAACNHVAGGGCLGRSHRTRGRRYPSHGNPRSGASQHVATIILAPVRLTPGIERDEHSHGEDILHTCQTANLRIAQLSHQAEPAEEQSRERINGDLGRGRSDSKGWTPSPISSMTVARWIKRRWCGCLTGMP